MKKNKLSYLYRKGDSTIIFLHGLGLNKENGNPLYSSKLFKNYGFLLPDIPGHGQSLKFKNIKSYNFKEVANIIFLLIKELNIESCELIVHSISSYFISFLLEEDLKINSIILIEGNLTTDDSSWTSFLSNLTEEELLKHHNLLKKTAFHLTKSKLNNNLPNSEISIYSKGLLDVDSNALWNYSKNSIKLLKNNLLIKSLKKYDGNLLYLRGNDKGYWSKTYNILKDLNFEIKKISKSTHFPHIDQPMKTAKHISRFYKLNV